MLIPPKAISAATLSYEELKQDRKVAQTFGQCALGKKVLFISSVWPGRTSYVPLDHIDRVFKRLAVSKGYFDGGIFGTLAYLVVRYDNGKEKAFRFKHEEHVNLLLNEIRRHTQIPIGKP